jgi:hypothetical protein
MNRHILTIGLFLITSSAFSQMLELDIHKNRLADFLKIEQSLGSERLESKSNYISQKGVAQPIQFKRKQNGIPDLICYYFYFQNDSTIDYILYEWDEGNFEGNNENLKKSPKEINAFIDKYNGLYNQISQAYGESKSEGSLNDLSKIEEGDFKKEDIWKPNDSTEIKSYIVLSSKYEKKGAMTINPAYRIRLYVSSLNKKTSENGLTKPDENKIKMLDSVLKTFLSDLQNKNIAKAKSNLSSVLINKVTNEQLENLRQNIKFDKSLIIYFTGIQMGQDGASYIMLQYKYDSDNNSMPKEFIKVIFDGENKILGIQPMKRI